MTYQEEYLEGITGVVEANSFENLCLWEKHQDKKTWLSSGTGFGATVGHLDGRPVCVSFFKATINGHKILFIDPTSEVVDHKMIQEWLVKNLPRTAFRGESDLINKTDAMNFHNVFPSKTGVFTE